MRLNVWGMWLEFETELDGAIDENAGMSMGMKENRRKSWV